MATTPKYFQGANYRLRNTITRDGAPWDLSGGSVNVIWVTPAGVQMSPIAATAQGTGSDGVYYYDVSTSFWTLIGLWQLTWKGVDAGGKVGFDGPYGLAVKKIKTSVPQQTPDS